MTSKALRTPPEYKLQDYVASIRKFSGGDFFKYYPDADFLSSQFVLDGSSIAGVVNTVLANVDLGFSVTINNVKYSRIAISQGGWVALQDPAATFSASHIVTTASSNVTIKNNFTYNHVLLAPWFDALYPVANSPSVLLADATYNSDSDFTTSISSNILAGKDARNWPINAVDRGTRYARFYDGVKGACFLVRWTGSPSYYSRWIKFEAAIYASGRIEYRYWPNQYLFNLGGTNFQSGDTNVSATVGAFWSSTSNGSNKFRDFAPLLDYDNGTARVVSELGGATYQASYTDGLSLKPYSVNLKFNNWPKNGAILTLSPPVKPAKFLPKKLAIVAPSVREIVRSPGLFDDRKTVSYVIGADARPVGVHMPSTLPSRLLGNTSDVDVSLRQLLFTSGSIQLASSGSVKKSIIDSQLNQLEILSHASKDGADRSFNESQKSYQTTAVTSSFYMTGSSLELFGDGFTAPLKSKTQFTYSFPVQNATTLSATSASIHYYDAAKKAWISPDFTSVGPRQMAIYTSGVETDKEHYFTIVESSIGFDAVGRKIVSGTNRHYYPSGSTLTPLKSSPTTLQTCNFIGSKVARNLTGSLISRNSVNENPTDDFGNSLTDNPHLYPEPSQQLNFSTDLPFLIESISVDLPIYASGDWFKDYTTCNRVFGGSSAKPPFLGFPSGAIDFGGPALTFAVLCARRAGTRSYVDIIASGTITHEEDAFASVDFYKNSGMNYYCMRPIGFNSFSNPTAVIDGTDSGGGKIFDDSVRLDIKPSVASGVTLAKNDRSLSITVGGVLSSDKVGLNRQKATELLTTPTIPILQQYEPKDGDNASVASYTNRTPRVYIQQLAPASRGSSKLEFNGNSILGGNVASSPVPENVNNPLYVASSLSSLPTDFQNKLSTAITDFRFEAISSYSTYNSRPSPYLLLPGDKITLMVSKTRPVIYTTAATIVDTFVGSNGQARVYDYVLTGSHSTVKLNTGDINVTFYGSYVKEGMEYHP
jgi:hypothetical protein